MKWIVSIFLCIGLADSGRAKPVVVGSKSFTEGRVLAEAMRLKLEDAGFEVEHRKSMGGTFILWQALLSGSIDAYVEYSGTLSEQILKNDHRPTLPELADQLAQTHPEIVLGPVFGFNNGYALVTKKGTVQPATISALKSYPQLRLGFTHEFINREDGWKSLKKFYGLPHEGVRGLEHNIAYISLLGGEIDLMEAYTTDSKLLRDDVEVLDDDRGFFPTYHGLILHRRDMSADAVSVLASFAGMAGARRMQEVNKIAEDSKDDEKAAAHLVQLHTAGPQSPTLDAVLDIGSLTLHHIFLVVCSLMFAILVGVPLGMVASRPGPLSRAIFDGASILQTIPSLALLAMLVPLLGISMWTAILALFLYSLLPIVRNTATGLQTISPAIRDAAEAIGLEPAARFRLVLLPVALPTVLAGIKTSMIINIGTATLAALIGAGGLGEPIVIGLSLNDYRTILSGAIPAAVLAVLSQAGFGWLERRLIPAGIQIEMKKKRYA